MTIAAFCAPFLVQAYTRGIEALLTLRFALESSVCGLVLSLIGNGIIALWRGAVSIDAGLLAEIAGLRQRVIEQDSFDATTETLLAAKVSKLSNDARAVLRLILRRGRADHFVIMNECALSLDVVKLVTADLFYDGLVELAKGGENQIMAPIEYKEFLKRLLQR